MIKENRTSRSSYTLEPIHKKNKNIFKGMGAILFACYSNSTCTPTLDIDTSATLFAGYSNSTCAPTFDIDTSATHHYIITNKKEERIDDSVRVTYCRCGVFQQVTLIYFLSQIFCDTKISQI